MEGHAKKCVERYCELANKKIQQLYKVSTPCIDDHHFKGEENEICLRIVTCMLSNCSEMLILGTFWKTWYSMVSEHTCSIHYKMDERLWQTIKSFDILHPSHMRIQTVLSCGKYCQAKQTGTVSRFWLCGRSWRFEIHFWRNIVRFGKSCSCSDKLDVQETNCCFTQFNIIWNHLFGCRDWG